MAVLLCIASLILLSPIVYMGLRLLGCYFKAIIIFGFKLNRWLVVVTLAGLIVGAIAFLLLLTGN